MDLPTNPLKAALASGRRQIGLWCTLPEPTVPETLAHAGYDWLVIDCEHAPNTPATLAHMLRAVEGTPAHAVVRAGWNDAVEIKRILDCGAQSVLVPYVQSGAEARAAVAATRYPPHGVRGVAGGVRASRFGAVQDYLARAGDEICVIVQAETAQALDRIEEIAATSGLDGIFIGPADLAASMGHLGRADAPQVRRAILDAVERISRAGVAAGYLGDDPAFLAEVADAGATFLAVGVDAVLLRQAAAGRLADWRG